MRKEAQHIAKLILISGLLGLLYGCDGGDDVPSVPRGSMKTSHITYDAVGIATGYVKYTNDANHNPSKAESMSVGPDNLPFTSDDTLTEYSLFRYDAEGRQVLFHYELSQDRSFSLPVHGFRYTGPGADTVWFTDDDVAYNNPNSVASYGSWEYYPDGTPAQTVVYNSPGDDMQWLSADDLVSYYMVFDAHAGNVMSSHRYYSSPGLDQLWFTVDDVMGFYFDGLKGYFNEGADGVWFTADDWVDTYVTSTTDSTTGVNYMRWFTIGTDAIAYTTDDYAFVSTAILHSPQLVFTASLQAGADMILGTVDDVWLQIPEKSEFDENGRLIKLTTYSSAGADNLYLTADDIVSGYAVITYHRNGSQLQRIEYVGAGLNGIWFDEDDEIAAYEDSTFASGFLRSIKRYTSAGLNLTWFDEDDVISTETRYSFYY